MHSKLSPGKKRLLLGAASAVAVTGLTVTPAIAGLTNLFDNPPAAGFRNVSGPNTLVPPYVVGSSDAVTIQSLLTTGDAGVSGYNMAGVPDALSLWKISNKSAVLLMNHELQATQGLVRAHGQKGAFVSRWTLKSDGSLVSGGDLIKSVKFWTGSGWESSPTITGDSAAFNRFCSGSLATPGQLRYNSLSGRYGVTDPIYFAVEEGGDNSRVFAVNVNTGEALELPDLGRASWETVTVAPTTPGVKTVTIGNEDGADDKSQVWVYSGTKKTSGNFAERSGLAGGSAYVMRINDANGDRVATDTSFRSKYSKGQSAPFTFAAIDTTKSGTAQNTQADQVGTGLSRVEDGHFDPQNPNVYYFITTQGGPNNGVMTSGGLWKMVFNDINNPLAGGTVTLLLDNTSLPRYNGTTGPAMNKIDNLVVDSKGNILIQEDPGNNAVISRIFAYRISDGAFAEIARFDANRFTPGGPQFITMDEESSGIIDASDLLGPNTYLFDAQVHSAKELTPGTGKGTVEELVEGGQLLRLTVSNWTTIYGS